MTAVAPKPPTATTDAIAPRIGVDELNICEFPLYASSHSANDGVITFEDDIFDEGANQRVHRKLTISASRQFGLPTPADSDVLLVLMHLTKLQNSFSQPVVGFTRYELIEMLRWTHGGKSYRRIEESLQRWASVTLYYNRAWWDKTGRRWRSKTFHVLETVDLRGRGESRDDGLSSFTWNGDLFNSFRANNVKRLDLDTYFKLKLPTARQAFRFLDKRFYRSKRLEADLRVFACEHLGLGRNYDAAQLRRKLQPAIEELEAIGFIELMPAADRFQRRRLGEWTITLIRRGAGGESQATNSATAVDPLVYELTSRGISEAAAKEFAGTHSSAKIREKIAIHDQKLKSPKPPSNPPGFLAAAIRDDFAAHSTSSKVIPIRALAERPRKRTAIAKTDDGNRLLIESFRRLPANEQIAMEKDAFANASKLFAEVYLRHQKTGGSKFESLRKELILSHLRRINTGQ